MIAFRRVVATVAVSGGLALIVGAAQAAPGDALEACLARCNRGKLSETNRETCRLDCEVDASTDPDLIRAEIERRQPKKKEDGGGASAGGTAPAASSGGASGEGRAACKARCDADRSLSVDDRATCKLECDFDDDPGAGPGSPPAAPSTGEPLVPRAPTDPGWPVALPPGPPAVAGGTVAPMGFLPMCLQTCRRGSARLRPTDIETCRLTCESGAVIVDFALDAVPSPWMSVATTPPEAVAVKLPTPTGARASSGGHTPVSAPPVSAPPVSAPAGTCDEALAICKGACDKQRTSCERECGRGRLNATDRESCKLDCGSGVELCRADCTGDHATCVNRR